MDIRIVGTGAMGSDIAHGLAKHHTVFLFDRNQLKPKKLHKNVKAKYGKTFQIPHPIQLYS